MAAGQRSAEDATSRPSVGAARACAAALAAVLAATMAGCSSPDAAELQPAPLPGPPIITPATLTLPTRLTPMPPLDLLTDVKDDGSLVAGLHHADPAVRRLAARALARLRPPAPAPPPPPAASDDEGEAEPPDSADDDASEMDSALLARALTEADEDALVEMLFALGQHAHAPAADFLADRLEHGTPPVRQAAAAALGRLADDGRTAALVARLRDDDPLVRGTAALALFRLDGRRYTHARTATDTTLNARDAALAEAALRDPDAGVRWRAVYTLCGVRGRGGIATALRLCLRDAEPLCRVFAVRGLVALQHDGLPASFEVAPLLADPDERVAIEAARAFAFDRPLQPLFDVALHHESAQVRLAAVESLAARLAPAAGSAGSVTAGGAPPVPELDASVLIACNDNLAAVAQHDESAMVRRAAAGALVTGRDPWRSAFFLHRLARSGEPRDRERAAVALQTASFDDVPTLGALLADTSPAVRAAALAAPRIDPELRQLRLIEAFVTGDPALRAAAAEAVQAPVLAGEESADVVRAAAAALTESDGIEMKEARQALRKTFGLRADADVPAERPPGRLLDRLLAEQSRALADPKPHVLFATSRGGFEVELLRAEAPRHVQNFLELAAAGCYDGLDLHRVVPDFVVQGLDPRGDGYGTGGRRLPDEINRVPFLTGTLGMPNAGEPNTGGCQIFFTHVPTPHLDGGYTVFGTVVAGQDVVQRLEIGDSVTSVRRAP